jgi:solute carrier family 35 protein F5
VPQMEIEDLHQSDKSKGVVFLILVVSIWTLSSFFIKSLEGSGSDKDGDVNIRELMIVLISNALLILFIIPSTLQLIWTRYGSHFSLWKAPTTVVESSSVMDPHNAALLDEENENNDSGNEEVLLEGDISSVRKDGEQEQQRQKLRRTALIGLKIVPVWCASNVFYIRSLCSTSVTSSTVISSCSCIFTAILGYFLKSEEFSKIKICGVLFTVAGVILTVLHDDDSTNKDTNDGNNKSTCVSEHSVFGDSLSLASSFCYSVYTCMFALMVSDASQVHLVLGWIGFWQTLIFIPIMVTFAFTEKNHDIENTLSSNFIFLVILKGLLDEVLSEYLWARAILLTKSPVLATVALSMTIPLALTIDLVSKNINFSLVSLLGCVLVFVGFTLLSQYS